MTDSAQLFAKYLMFTDIEGCLKTNMNVVSGMFGDVAPDGDLAQFRRVFPFLKVEDEVADGHCFFRAASRLLHENSNNYQLVRDRIASALDVEFCAADDVGAIATFKELHEGDPSNRYFRFVNEKMRAASPLFDPAVYVSFVRSWADGTDAPLSAAQEAAIGLNPGQSRDPHCATRIHRNILGDVGDPPTKSLVPLQARAMFIRSPRGIYQRDGEENRVTWVEQPEIGVLQQLLGVRIAVLITDDDDDSAHMLSLADVNDETQSLPVVFFGMSSATHYFSIVDLDDAKAASFFEARDAEPVERGGAVTDNDSSAGSALPPPPTTATPVLIQSFQTQDECGAYIRDVLMRLIPPSCTIRSSGAAMPFRLRCNACRAHLLDGEQETDVIVYKKRKNMPHYELVRNREHRCGLVGAAAQHHIVPSEIDFLASKLCGFTGAAFGVKDVHTAMSALGRPQLDYNTAWRVASGLTDRLFGTPETNWATLRSYLAACAVQWGPEFYWHVQTDAAGMFVGLFVVPVYAQQFTKHSVAICAVDAAHARPKDGKATWFVTTAAISGVSLRKDASSTVVVAFSYYAGGETNAGWLFHFSHMRRARLFADRARVVCGSDGRIGLPEMAAKSRTDVGANDSQFDFVMVRDIVHIARNIAAAVDSNRQRLVPLSWANINRLLRPIALARTQTECAARLAALADEHHPSQIARELRVRLRAYVVANMLANNSSVHPNEWLVHRCPLPRADIVTTNHTEDFNATLITIGARHAPVRTAVHVLLQYLHKRYDMLRARVGLGVVDDGVEHVAVRSAIAPLYGAHGEAFLKAKGFRYLVRPPTATGNIVVETPTRTTKIVRMNPPSCSCMQPSVVGTPCSHVAAVVAAGYCAVEQFTAVGFLRSDLLSSLGKSIEPVVIDMETLARDNLRPVVIDMETLARDNLRVHQSAEPRSHRRRRFDSIGEHAQDEGAAASTTTSTKRRVIRWSVCNAEGHNARLHAQQ